ncbi:hypothetical protein [Streptomyces sp. NPDC055210]
MTDAKGNAVLVEALGSSLRRGGNALQDVPGLLKRILAEEAWKDFTAPRGERIQHARFADFVTQAPTSGIGASIALVRKLVADDPEALDLFDRAVQRESGGSSKIEPTVDNLHSEDDLARPSGTSREAGLRRLRKARPDLHTEVLAGTLSTHAAMVAAGFRKRKISVPVGSPIDTAKALRRNLEPEQIKEVVKLLTED